MNKISCKGRLRHCWWETYHATIGLFCKDPFEAAYIQSKLGAPWRVNENDDRVILYHGCKDELEGVLSQLESLGADRNKMTSIMKSIDFGEEFTISVSAK